MRPLRLVTAFFLAPFASAAIAVALTATNVSMSGPQDDGKYVPTFMDLLVPIYLIALVLSIPLYFLLSRLKWTSLRQMTVGGAIAPAAIWLCLALVLFRSSGSIMRFLVLGLAGAAWGLAFWWLAFRSRAESSSFPTLPIQPE